MMGRNSINAPRLMSVPIDMMLPQELFVWLNQRYRSRFCQPSSVATQKREVVPKSSGVAWPSGATLRLAHHPMMQRPDWAQKVVPIKTHQDGVPAIRKGRAGTKSLDVTSFPGLLSRGTTRFV